MSLRDLSGSNGVNGSDGPVTRPRPPSTVREVMAERTRFWRSNRWRDALRPDTDLAQAEGLAAGTGLLTGTVAKTAGHRKIAAPDLPCPACGASSEIVVVDLIVHVTTLRCPSCGRRWTTHS